jgi:hypothetical protein
MPWYKTGTVSVTLNSNAVIGTGTAFIANSRVGDGFRGPDGGWYEVTNIASDTAMSISPNYKGATSGAGGYALAPLQGYVKDSADALRALVNQYGVTLAALGSTGNYEILPVNKGGTGGATQGDARAALGLGSVATDNIVPVTRGGTGGSTQAAAQAGLGLIPTTGPYDSTTGRVMKIGDMGIGRAAATYDGVESMNTFFKSNQFFTSAQPLPAGLNDALLGTYPMGLHFSRSTNVESQLVIGWAAGNGNLGFRIRPTDSAWNPWRKVYDSGNSVGTVADTAGVQTGALMEYGENANGEYWKYANGQLICRRTDILASQAVTSPNGTGLFFSPAQPRKSYAMPFVTAPSTKISASSSSSLGWAVVSGLPNSAQFEAYYLYEGQSTSRTYTVDSLAIGRWK